jgi:hypothetical protein
VKNLAIDIHAHALIGKADEIARQEDRWGREVQEVERIAGPESSEHNLRLMQTAYLAGMTIYGVAWVREFREIVEEGLCTSFSGGGAISFGWRGSARASRRYAMQGRSSQSR